MFTFLKRLSTIRTFWTALAAFVTINILYSGLNLPQVVLRAAGYRGNLNWYAIDNAIGAPPTTIYGFVANYGHAGRSVVIVNHLTFDVLFPLTYMLFFAISLTLIGSRLFRTDGAWRWLTLVPIVAGVCDYLENAGIVTMCLSYPLPATLAVARVTSVFTLLKVSFLGLSMALVVIGGVGVLIHWAITSARGGSRSKRMRTQMS